MRSSELKERVQKIIDEARTKTTIEQEQNAEFIVDRIPDLVKEAAEKGRNYAVVMYLDREPTFKKFITSPPEKIAKAIILSHPSYDPIFEVFFGGHPKNKELTAEYDLTATPKIVFEKCKEAGLNPFVARTKEDPSRWTIVIYWE